MLSNGFPPPAAGWAAIATGIVGLLGLAFIVLFFTVGSPFGTLNDICNGLAAVLSVVLGWTLYSRLQMPSPLISKVTLILAVVGAILALIGSYLVMSGTTGWYLAGLFTATGYAMIGLWLLGWTAHALQDHSLPRGLVIFGLITSVVLILGLGAIPGISRGIDSDTYELTVFNVFWWTGSLGYLTIYPVWCILMGRLLLSGSLGD